MKSSKRVVQRRAGAGGAGGAKGGKAADPTTEKKVEAARSMAEQIAARLAQPSAMEKDATHLTAEAIMKGTEAAPITLSVCFSGIPWKNILKQVGILFHYSILCNFRIFNVFGCIFNSTFS